jgi:hypothetical protein
MLKNNLENIAGSFGRKVTDMKFGLTPKEIEICNMIKSGFTNKDIAEQSHLWGSVSGLVYGVVFRSFWKPERWAFWRP